MQKVPKLRGASILIQIWEGRGGMATTFSLKVCTKILENPAQNECFQCQFEKNGGFAVVLLAKPSVLLRNNGLGLKVTQAW